MPTPSPLGLVLGKENLGREGEGKKGLKLALTPMLLGGWTEQHWGTVAGRVVVVEGQKNRG